MFRHDTTVRLRHTDAAGVIYFAEQLVLCHEAYEAFLARSGHPLGGLLGAGDIGLPIVHAQVDLTAPVFVSDPLRIDVFAERVGTTSFTLGYQLARDGTPVGAARTVHVAIDARTRAKTDLPGPLRALIMTLRAPDAGPQAAPRDDRQT